MTRCLSFQQISFTTIYLYPPRYPELEGLTLHFKSTTDPILAIIGPISGGAFGVTQNHRQLQDYSPLISLFLTNVFMAVAHISHYLFNPS